ncbi:hypothetical protein [Paraburkholderia caballeronis]|uniref:Uncharacterized protein n=1 Tax=Paraburkholderia caballeronis TaxID=416943 RepID=A0A1H7RHE9_9BURK|nr:hypothetical protein [Paraburkholderia caballeronis]PXW23029.1 hypothetical protein C7403_11111 [Paraburkholderia caballeronis]PXW97693.1 hypothetical protein C7407_11111 [Paraburkholderia caballeronis]RAJ94663.1 hypothetical protein C7409_11111 [Paraburkholderia caballeronis]TDV11793.1 hypothetical protein C7408_111148 [Paraburkholderia caballeronis]TDV14874.1 hypothetical protein C7406_112148 [Paraburkholderia caballeronis]
MAVHHPPKPRGSHDVRLVGDSPVAPLAISLAAFVIACAALVALALPHTSGRWQTAFAMLVIAAMAAASWCFNRALRTERRKTEAARTLPSAPHRATRPRDVLPAAAPVRRFTDLRTTECHRESSDGKAFTVRCFRADCPSAPTCPTPSSTPAPQRPDRH